MNLKLELAEIRETYYRGESDAAADLSNRIKYEETVYNRRRSRKLRVCFVNFW